MKSRDSDHGPSPNTSSSANVVSSSSSNNNNNNMNTTTTTTTTTTNNNNNNNNNGTPALQRHSSTAVLDVTALPAPSNAAEAAAFNMARVCINKARTVRADAFADALRSLMAVAVPVGKDASKSSVRQLVQRVESHALGTLSDAVGQGGVLTCAALMHEHAVWTGTTLTSTDVRRCLDVLRAYVAHADAHGATLKPIAVAFLQYLTTHAIDPENTLVGLRAGERALKDLLSHEAIYACHSFISRNKPWYNDSRLGIPRCAFYADTLFHRIFRTP